MAPLNKKTKIVLYSLGSLALLTALLTAKKMNWIAPALAKITHRFGPRVHPVTKKPQIHNGVDLALPEGTELKAPANAVVLKTYFNNIGGKQVILKHENGFKTGYAHLSKFLKEPGEQVKQGEVFALSGNTGRSTGPHLHITLKDEKNNYLDPEKFLFT